MILVVSGPGGVGKGTIVERLLKQEPELWLSRSWTTRPRRQGESPDAYRFVSREDFEKRLADGGFLEWNEFASNGHLYGTPTLEPPPGSDVCLEIELNGAKQVKSRYPEAVLVLVVPPDFDALRERMQGRGDDSPSIDRRLTQGLEEVREGEQIADAVVTNDDLARATDEVAAILAATRASRRAPSKADGRPDTSRSDN